MERMRLFRRLAVLALLLYVGAWAFRIVYRKYYVWLPGYVSWKFHQEKAGAAPVHVFFLFTDHYEPGDNYAMVQQWVEGYPKIADRHRDHEGRPWQHTFFYPAEQPIERNMTALRGLVRAGYGEVELHLHHGNDTNETGRERLRASAAYLQKFDFLKATAGATHFAYIRAVSRLHHSHGPHFSEQPLVIYKQPLLG